MLIEVMTLNQKVWKPSEGQMASDKIPFLGGPDRKLSHPPYFEQSHRTLLRGRVPHGHELSVLRLAVK